MITPQNIKPNTEKISPPLLSVVLSFCNEEEVIPELTRRLTRVLEGEKAQGHIADYELIFVNDASTDRSLEILLEHRRQNKNIKIVNMSRNFGNSACIMAGIKYCRGDMVVYMDADLQDPPELIPQLLQISKEKSADVVHTVRKSRAGESKIKLLATKLGYFILKKVSSVNIKPQAGDYKLLSRRVVDQLGQLNEYRPFIRGLVSWVGFKEAYIEYHRDKRFAGKTKFRVFGKKVIGNFLNSALISFSDVPLKLASIMGFLISIGSFAFLIYVIIRNLLGRNLPGWSAIMVTMLFLGGLKLLAIGHLEPLY